MPIESIEDLKAEVAYLKSRRLTEQTIIALRASSSRETAAEPAQPEAEPPVFVRFNSDEPPNAN